MKQFPKVFLLVICLFLATGGKSLQDEINIGKSSDAYIRKYFGVYKNKAISDYVSKVGQSLLKSIEDPEFEYHYTVIEDPMLNAFAVPGGYIYVTTGMLAYLDSEAALAVLLGHETGHVIDHHSIRQMKKSMGDALLIFAGLAGSIASGGGSNTAAVVMAGSSISSMKRLGYGRELELRADELGIIYAYEAGYDPMESSKMFKTLRFKERIGGMEYHGFSATHPDTIERIIKSEEKAKILKNRGGPVSIGREKYLNAMRGLSWGKFNRRKKTKPNFLIDIYKVKKGDTFKKIAKELSKDKSLAFELAVMNSMKPEEKPKAGMLIKVPIPKKSFKKNEEKKKS